MLKRSVHAFDGLPVIAVTPAYSWRLQRNFAAHSDYLAEFEAQRRDIPVVILSAMGHSDMITNPQAISAIAREFRQ